MVKANESQDRSWRDGETLLTTTDVDREPSSAVVPALTILAHPEASRVGERIALPLLALGQEVRLSRLEPVFRSPSSKAEGTPLAERSISRRAIRLHGRVGGGADALLLDARATRTRVLVERKEVEVEHALSAAELEQGVVLQLGRHVVLLLHRVTLPFPGEVPPWDLPRYGMVGESDALLRLCEALARLAPLDVAVLLRGESGTGKELAARALHEGGGRSGGPFVAVNMATLSPSLAAAELFGAVRGAYTGADRSKEGFFRGAEGGTLFLDEIGETPIEVQAMLLRVLENREVVPVGSTKAQKADVRVVAATDARLEEAITDGRFRTPLYHRLAGYAVRLPPLRERRDDIARLLVHFLAEEHARLGRGTVDEGDSPGVPDATVVGRLARHDWPGNIRELRNVARRLALEGQSVSPDDLLMDAAPFGRSAAPSTELEAGSDGESSSSGSTPGGSQSRSPRPRRLRRRPAEVSEEELLATLEAHDYKVRETAEALDLSRINFYRRIEQSPNVRKAADLERPEIGTALAASGGDVAAAARALRVSEQGLKRRMTALDAPAS